MVGTLASRIAGLKLGFVVAVLLIPLIYLAWFMNAELIKDITFVQKEIKGVQFARLITPIYTASDRGADLHVQLASKVAEGQPFAEKLNLADTYQTFKQTQLARNGTRSSHLESGDELMDKLGTESNLVLDPEVETNRLASTLVSWVPNLSIAIDALQVAQETGAKPFEIYQKAADLKDKIEHIDKMLQQASDASSDRKEYETIAAASELMNQVYAARAAQLNAGQFTGADSAAFYSATQDLALQVSNRLEPLLTQRLNKVVSYRAENLAAALLAIIVGMGSALWMFRSTLNKLDELAIAKRKTEALHSEAESMNAQLTEVNENMAKLNTDLATRMFELKTAQDELLKKGRLEQLGQLVATVAHELRNPLGAVRTSAFLIEKRIRDKGLALDSQLARINNGITRCDSVITQLLDFSRTRKIDAFPADLDGWLLTTLEEQAKTLPNSITINCDLGLEGALVPFDPARMTRAVTNLLSNAAEALIEDISNPARPQPIVTITTAKIGADVVLKISDNGPGMTDEILAKIKEPLFTTKNFGTGLGVPAVEQIAVQHGGKLEVESEAGKGATFSVYLPLNPIAEAA